MPNDCLNGNDPSDAASEQLAELVAALHAEAVDRLPALRRRLRADEPLVSRLIEAARTQQDAWLDQLAGDSATTRARLEVGRTRLRDTCDAAGDDLVEVLLIDCYVAAQLGLDHATASAEYHQQHVTASQRRALAQRLQHARRRVRKLEVLLAAYQSLPRTFLIR